MMIHDPADTMLHGQARMWRQRTTMDGSLCMWRQRTATWTSSGCCWTGVWAGTDAMLPLKLAIIMAG
jgi:hypothetical protein